jgi:hypothetical protein
MICSDQHPAKQTLDGGAVTNAQTLLVSTQLNEISIHKVLAVSNYTLDNTVVILR